ncbi:MAG: hypothetical protein P9L92_01830 [Candidatus Electryonea clarkiae]|nr:hypothetical protein [Candidatus Electryonea clarkiae]MDP8285998.1 hypothetical protein [Candidatus Electryonea clarkiae]
MKINLVERDEEIPLCPHCKKRLDNIWFRELKGDMGKRIVYFCSSCRAVLSISHRKGLTMGL